MSTQIVIHLLPSEIDWFEWQSKQFKLGSYNIKSKVIIDVTLNLNLVDWNKSKIPKQFFIDKFNQIKRLWDWAEIKFDVDAENIYLGCNDKRREAIRSTNADNILYLDSDVLFQPELLKTITEATNLINHEYYIVSPQTVKMWDNSWDVITNEEYLLPHSTTYSYCSNDPFQVISKPAEQVKLRSITEFKFGGGWFNLISTKLLKLTDIPDSLGPYGVDDTYVALCCYQMKLKGLRVQQYLLDGLIVTENCKYRFDPYTNYLHSINKQDAFRTQSQKNLESELQNFKLKIKL
jgi:hypothetical protein